MELKNPLSGKSRTVQILVVIGILLLIGAAAAVIYKLAASNTVDVNVTNQIINIPITLTASAASITEGQSVTLTATATGTDAPNAVGLAVVFKEGATTVGTAAIANVGGVYKAEITITPAVGSHTYQTAATP